MLLKKILDEFVRKSRKIWLDHANEFQNRLMEPWQQVKDTEIYLTHKEGKSAFTQRFIRTHERNRRNMKNKITDMSAILKSMYLYKLDEMNDKYNSSGQRAIKIKPVDVTSGKYIDFDLENNVKDP